MNNQQPAKTYPMLSFRCDISLREAIDRKAFERGISVSELIKQAITEHLAVKE